MAGLPVPSTADVMGKTIRLQSSKKTSSCSEDTLIFLGVSGFLTRGDGYCMKELEILFGKLN